MLGTQMEAEIRDQVRLLQLHSAAYETTIRSALDGFRPEMVLLVARGTSDNAALYARYLVEIHLGVPVSLAAPSVITRYGSRIRYPKCLAIGISQSGAAPDVSEVLSALRADGHATLAITNTCNSRVTQTAEHTLLLDAGEEKAIAATKTYTTSLLALYGVVRALGGDLPDPAHLLPDATWVEATRTAAEEGLGYILRSGVLFALARGYDFCTAQECGLKLMECAMLSCKSYSTADFQHGPKALAGPGSAAIVFGDFLPEIAKQGCELVVAPPVPTHVPEELRPIWNAFYAQWLALLAARARAFDPDKSQFLTKVTETL